MADKLSGLEGFWNELKRRKTIRVITVYAAAAFIILQLVDIIAKPLQLPDWTLTLVIVLLIIGFIIAALLSWIYDITPTGVTKTKSVSHSQTNVTVKPVASNTWKIISYVSIVIIIAMAAFNIVSKIRSENIINLEKTIAVLPFRNLSNDSTQLYFCDGFMDDILNNLQKVKSFTVRPRTSSYQYRDAKKSTVIIGNELNVNYLVEGSVGHEGNNLKISVQLIDSKADKQLWSDEYIREMKQIFSLQSEIAKEIATELKAVLSTDEIEKIEKKPTENLEAYNLYLQGRFFWNKRTEEGLKKSIEYFNKAIALDENYALAIAGLADAYNVQAFWGWSPAKAGYVKAKELAERAIEIDNKLAEAHATLGNILCYGEWKWEEARKELLLAIELNPKYATAHQYYSELLDVIGQNEEARLQINLALELDPYNLLMHNISVQNYYHEGNLSKSLEECLKMQELDPAYSLAYLWSFNIYIRQREDIKAVEALQKMMLLDTIIAKHAYEVKDVYKKSRMTGLIDWLIELNLKMDAHFFYVADSTFYLAKWYAMLDKKEKAIDWLEKSIENRSKIAQINNDPDFDNLRSESRFRKLIGEMGLSVYAKKE
jgi:TolB-like protein